MSILYKEINKSTFRIYNLVKKISSSSVRCKSTAAGSQKVGEATRTTIGDINKDGQIGQELILNGWIQRQRNMKGILFLDLNDGTSVRDLQININKAENKLESNPGYGSAVQVCGTLAKTPKGELELLANNVQLLGKCNLTNGDYPFLAKQEHPPEYVRNHLHLRSRVKSFQSLLRLRHHASLLFHNYLDKEGFIQISTPILTSNDCEGGGEIFTIKPDSEAMLKEMAKHNVKNLEEAYFDRKAFLTVSGQLHLEAMCHGLGNVYTMGPAFRAENSRTPFHLSEFYMLELEQAFVSSLSDCTEFLEKMFKSVSMELLDKYETEMENARPPNSARPDFKWLANEFKTLTFKETIAILQANRSKLKSSVNAKFGLTREQELFMVKHCDGPVFVVNWPKELKSFYMKEKDDDGEVVEAFDFLCPGIGEMAGGSVRENNYELLREKLPAANDLEWYLSLRRYGGIKTAGFGMGFERYLQLLTGITSIKDVIPFPRWPHHCSM